MRLFLVVLDSVGIGAAPDAAEYGDSGSATLSHTAAAANGLDIPCLTSLGLGNIPSLLPGGIPIQGVPETKSPLASFGALQELSVGKDTTTGHWELAGILMKRGLHLFPHAFPSFPDTLISEFCRRTGRKIMGNRAASGTKIIEELGREHMETGAWIVYTSADSVFQIAAHEGIIPLEELYAGCRIARSLCDPLFVGRVIARPFIGKPGEFTRTENRRDFSLIPPEPTVLDHVQQHGIPVITVGKLDDIFAGRGISEMFHLENNRDACRVLMQLGRRKGPFFAFANLIDFDMLYGHRRDAPGYAGAINKADEFLSDFLPLLTKDDLLIITADHGNDPTFSGTDHTREYVPLLAFSPGRPGLSVGVRQGFFDVAQTITDFFNLPPWRIGRSFLGRPSAS